jgi:hypothetical protein
MIIISQPSAEAARRVHTERSSRARSRRRATRSDTPMHANAQPISVHTTHRDLRPLNVPGIVLRRIAGIKGAALRRR